jgi:hypothetical protein
MMTCRGRVQRAFSGIIGGVVLSLSPTVIFPGLLNGRET